MTPTPTPGAAAELPITEWESWNKYTGDCWGPLTPQAPAQAQLDALREEVARLKGELRVIASKRDLEAGRCDALVGEVARLNSIAPTSRAGAVLGQMKSELDEARLEVARLTKERDEAREDLGKLVRRVPELAGETQRLHTELADLKAQPTDVDEVMALADKFADSKHDYRVRACYETEHDYKVFREALRAKLAARKEPT